MKSHKHKQLYYILPTTLNVVGSVSSADNITAGERRQGGDGTSLVGP